MITGLRLRNFKAFEDTCPKGCNDLLRLAPVTLLSGVNSSGKSSIIQALRLLKDTLNAGADNPLAFDRYARSFDELVFGKPDLREASFGFDLEFTYPAITSLDGQPGSPDEPRDNDEKSLFDHLRALLVSETSNLCDLAMRLGLEFSWGPFGPRGRPAARLSDLRLQVSLRAQGELRSVIGYQIEPAGSGGKYVSRHLAEATHPDLAYFPLDLLQAARLERFLPIWQWETFTGVADRNLPGALLPFMSAVVDQIRLDLYSNLRYLSSFRASPEPVYYGSPTLKPELNDNGSDFAPVLFNYRDEPTPFTHPDLPPSDGSLAKTTAWVLNHLLGLPQRLDVHAYGGREDNIEVLLETLGKFEREPGKLGQTIQIPLGAVGLGYNQILPVIVQGLLTPPGGLIIFEQPEIHLHPNVQARLVQFLEGLARAGRQVLVETHSDHLVDYLCLGIVKDHDDWLHHNSQVYFVHPQDAQHASAMIEQVQIDRFGDIVNYPEGFLPDKAAFYEQKAQEALGKLKR